MTRHNITIVLISIVLLLTWRINHDRNLNISRLEKLESEIKTLDEINAELITAIVLVNENTVSFHLYVESLINEEKL